METRTAFTSRLGSLFPVTAVGPRGIRAAPQSPTLQSTGACEALRFGTFRTYGDTYFFPNSHSHKPTKTITIEATVCMCTLLFTYGWPCGSIAICAVVCLLTCCGRKYCIRHNAFSKTKDHASKWSTGKEGNQMGKINNNPQVKPETAGNNASVINLFPLSRPIMPSCGESRN